MTRPRRLAVPPFALVLALGLGVGLAACGGGDDSTDDAPAGETLVVTDPAQEIAASVGDRIEIELDLNVESGYRWELAEAPETAIVVVAGESVDGVAADEGTSSVQHVRFDVVGAGATTLEFRYVQPWVDPPAPRSTIAFDVRVGG